MTLVSPTQSNPGDTIDASDINDPINQIAAVVNGNIDSTNISSLTGAKLQAGTVPASSLDTNTNVETRMSESLGNFVASGCVWSITSGLTGAMTSGVVYISGKRVVVSSVASQTFAASKDTYVSVDINGTVSVANAVANGATAPSLPASSIWLAIVITGASITKILQLGTDSTVNLAGLGASNGYAKFTNTADPIYPTIASRLANWRLRITNSTQATGASASYNPMPTIAFNGVAGQGYYLTIHEPSILGYSGSGLIDILVSNSSTTSGGTQVGEVRSFPTASGGNIDSTVYFTALFNGMQYLVLTVSTSGITGTLNYSTSATSPATYTVSKV